MSKRILMWLTLMSLTTGCSTYRERFTYYGDNGQTNHVVDVCHRTFLMFGQAAMLKTETQTSEFIRTVNAEGLLLKTDSDSVKAISEGVVRGIKASGGIP